MWRLRAATCRICWHAMRAFLLQNGRTLTPAAPALCANSRRLARRVTRYLCLVLYAGAVLSAHSLARRARDACVSRFAVAGGALRYTMPFMDAGQRSAH